MLEEKDPQHAKLSTLAKPKDLPEIEEYDRPALEKFEKPEFGKAEKKEKVGFFQCYSYILVNLFTTILVYILSFSVSKSIKTNIVAMNEYKLRQGRVICV